MENVDIIVETLQDGIRIIKFNRPKKKNAINRPMYERVTDILRQASEDEDISTVVITGMGDYYSSGNDLKASAEMMKSNAKVNSSLIALKEYIQAFITFPKTLIAIVNGPAIGIATTTLALCDLVFASEDAFFYTPFSKLGMVAEGCSTYTFPRLIGYKKAMQMLLFDYKMSAQEALSCGLVTSLYKPEEIQSQVWDKIAAITQLSQKSIWTSKKLMRRNVQDEMIKANESEIAELQHLWTSNLKKGSPDSASKSKL